jgi:hypothetical protein
VSARRAGAGQIGQDDAWDDMATIIHEDNAFCYPKDVLPSEEGAAPGAEFDVEMDRLHAIMNEGKEMPDY